MYSARTNGPRPATTRARKRRDRDRPGRREEKGRQGRMWPPKDGGHRSRRQGPLALAPRDPGQRFTKALTRPLVGLGAAAAQRPGRRMRAGWMSPPLAHLKPISDSQCPNKWAPGRHASRNLSMWPSLHVAGFRSLRPRSLRLRLALSGSL